MHLSSLLSNSIIIIYILLSLRQSETNLLGKSLGRERLGALDRSTDSTVNDDLRKDTKSTSNTEQNGVEVLLSKTVVLQQDTGVGVDIGPGVFDLLVSTQDLGGDLVDLGDELEQVVVRHVLETELALGGVTGVGLTEDSMTVAGNNTASLESVPQVLLDLLVGDVRTDLLTHAEDPLEHLLVSTAMERTGKTVETSSNGQVGGGEGGADQVGGVGRNVATLVVRVDGKVQTHQLSELGVVDAELLDEVGTVVEVGVGLSDNTILEDIAVDAGSNRGQLGDQVKGVLESVLPVVLLSNALLVGLGELRGGLQSVDGNAQLSHGVQVLGAVVEQVDDVLGEGTAGVELLGKRLDLLLGGDLTSEKEPEQTLRKGLLTTLGLGQLGRALGDGQTAEADTLIGVQNGTLPNQGGDTTHTTVDLVELDLTKDGAVVSGTESLDLLNILGDLGAEHLLEGGLLSGVSTKLASNNAVEVH